MDDRIRRLRTRLHALTRGKAPTGIRYPPSIRAEVVGLVREARTRDVRMARIAAGLGVSAGTIAQWQKSAPRRALRPVTLAADAGPPAFTPAASLVLVTPQGWRVEGLDVATLLRILHARG
jgi:transposase-like protein